MRNKIVSPNNNQLQCCIAHPGIPQSLTMDFIRQWVRQRVSEKRLKHIEGVVNIALTLAPYVSCDLYLAQLAAWLHDSCKEIKASKLVAMAQSLGLTVEDVDQSQGHLLHGPVAACTIQSELRITNNDVLKAISEHTLGEAPMCNLSKVLFVADALEESRPKDYTDPIWTALDLRGSCDLDSAIVVICDLNMQYLIEAGKPIHPRAIIVRNYYLGKRSHHI